MHTGRPSVNESVADVLVIGYGNDLRRDDGAGRWVADRLEELDLDGVETRSVPQLTPELALEVADRPMVVFVDASLDADHLSVDIVERTSETSTVMTHHGSPAALLDLGANVGSQPDVAHVVSIPASDLEMGFDFSVRTAQAAEEAVQRVIELTGASTPTS